MSATQIVRVLGQSFVIRSPFREGHQLSAGEAQALNGLWAESIRDNLRIEVKRTLDAFGPVLTPEQQRELQATFTKYDSGYSFIQKHSARSAQDRFEAELQELAAERAREHFRQIGTEDPAEGALQELVDRFKLDPRLRGEAQQRLDAKQKVSIGSINDLLGVDELGL